MDLPDYIGRTANTAYADRYCARTGSGFGLGSHRIQTDGPSEAQVIAGGLARAAVPMVVIACIALFAAAFAHHGIVDHGRYPAPQTVALGGLK